MGGRVGERAEAPKVPAMRSIVGMALEGGAGTRKSPERRVSKRTLKCDQLCLSPARHTEGGVPAKAFGSRQSRPGGSEIAVLHVRFMFYPVGWNRTALLSCPPRCSIPTAAQSRRAAVAPAAPVGRTNGASVSPHCRVGVASLSRRCGLAVAPVSRHGRHPGALRSHSGQNPCDALHFLHFTPPATRASANAVRR